MTQQQGTTGMVYLVGAGAGDVGLLTLKGNACIAKADVVVYDRLVSPQVLALVPQTAEKIDVGKQSGNHPTPQWRINEILLEQALLGKQVVRLKGGDPFVFGRGGEELELLKQNGVPFAVVPGITSAISAAAYAGIPVTHRDCCSSLHIITGHAKQDMPLDIDFDALVRTKGTLIFLMGVSSLPAICQGLLAAHMPPDMPAAMVQNGTLPNQRKLIATVGTLAAHAKQEAIQSPAITIVGKVSALDFDWFSNLPLKGCNVLVTRPKAQAGKLCEKLRTLGANALEYPCISLARIQDNAPLQSAMKNLADYEYLVFTSAQGVDFFMEQVQDIRALYGLKLAAIGSATASALQAYKLTVDYFPQVYDAAHLAQGLCKIVKGKALLVRARMGTPELPRILEENGIRFTDVPLYDTLYQSGSPEMTELITAQINQGAWNYITFTSASTVEGFLKSLAGADLNAFVALCIGEQTANAAMQAGMKVMQSQKATIDSMIERLQELWQQENQKAT